MNNKKTNVTFATLKLESTFEELKQGKFEDKRLYEFIERAIKDIKINPIENFNRWGTISITFLAP